MVCLHFQISPPAVEGIGAAGSRSRETSLEEHYLHWTHGIKSPQPEEGTWRLEGKLQGAYREQDLLRAGQSWEILSGQPHSDCGLC